MISFILFQKRKLLCFFVRENLCKKGLPGIGECLILNNKEKGLLDKLVRIIKIARELSDDCNDILYQLEHAFSERIEERGKADRRFHYIEEYKQAYSKNDKEGKEAAQENLEKLITDQQESGKSEDKETHFS